VPNGEPPCVENCSILIKIVFGCIILLFESGTLKITNSVPGDDLVVPNFVLCFCEQSKLTLLWIFTNLYIPTKSKRFSHI
jgi:hypothetical protein